MSAGALFNGAPVTPDLAFHRGLHYGDGVFRTCLVDGSRVVDLEAQLDKILLDAARLKLETKRRALEKELVALATHQARAVIKVLLLRAGAERGYRASSTAADRLLLRYPAPVFAASAWQRGIRARKSDFRLAAQPRLAGIKHLNRLEQVLASAQWPGKAGELIVGDDQGRPVCGTRTNLFWVTRGRLRTPALDRCGVAGVMRDKVLKLAGAAKVPARIAAGSWHELAGAEEAFVTNSLIGIWPLASLGTRRWRAPGEVTRDLMQRLQHPQRAPG